MLEMADINVRSIKVVEVNNKESQEQTETNGNGQTSLDPTIIEAEVCEDGSTSQHQTVDAD